MNQKHQKIEVAVERECRATLCFGEHRFAALVGKSGTRTPAEKREGDGATPLGLYPLRRVFYRADRMAQPQTALPCLALEPDFGWCDDARDKNYNRFVRLPYRAGCEKLWRADALYDIIVPLGFNDDPPQPHKGSAIFLHCAAPVAPAVAGTEGCVALAREDLLTLLQTCDEKTTMLIKSASQK